LVPFVTCAWLVREEMLRIAVRRGIACVAQELKHGIALELVLVTRARPSRAFGVRHGATLRNNAGCSSLFFRGAEYGAPRKSLVLERSTYNSQRRRLDR
jgi:hypothetical protein